MCSRVSSLSAGSTLRGGGRQQRHRGACIEWLRRAAPQTGYTCVVWAVICVKKLIDRWPMIALKSLQARLLVTVLGLLLLVWLIAPQQPGRIRATRLNELLMLTWRKTAALAASRADDEMEAG